MLEQSEPEQPKDLEKILIGALQKAGEQGLLEGVSDAELARLTIQAKTKADVMGTGALSEGSEISEEHEMQEVIAAYEKWRDGGPKPEGIEPPGGQRYYMLCYLKKKSGNDPNAYWVFPNLDHKDESVSPILYQLYEAPEALKRDTDFSYRFYKLVKPAWVGDKNDLNAGVTRGELGPMLGLV